MKTITKLCSVSTVAFLLGASAAQASLSIVLRDTPNRQLNSTLPGYGGGEFIAQATGQNFTQYYYNGAGNNDAVYQGGVNANQGVGFVTFCLEHGEFVSFNTSYTAALSLSAVAGGGGAVNGHDTISRGTAWLYTQFAKGTLASYDYNYNTAGRDSSAGLLQQAFWYLEDEVSLTATQIASNPFLQAAKGKFSDDLAVAKLNTTSEYAVLVLNMYDAQGNKVQDQLVIVPEASTIMAGALLLLPFGASTVRILRKKSLA